MASHSTLQSLVGLHSAEHQHRKGPVGLEISSPRKDDSMFREMNSVIAMRCREGTPQGIARGMRGRGERYGEHFVAYIDEAVLVSSRSRHPHPCEGQDHGW